MPFKGSKLELRYIFSILESQGDIAKQMTRFILIILNKLYMLSYSIYKTMSSPDINVDAFVEIIVGSIGQIKQQVGHCDKAYKKIIESTYLLKDNFGNYYKDFVETRQSTVFIENFIVDVSQSVEADMETVAQFGKIIKYYRDKAGSRVKQNPLLEKVFDTLAEKMSELKKYTNIVDVDNGIDPLEKIRKEHSSNGKEEEVNEEESADEEEPEETEGETAPTLVSDLRQYAKYVKQGGFG